MPPTKKNARGFTLIELLVVVLIIGILAAIAVPQYFKVVEKGKFSESMQWLGGLKGAQERYLARNGTYSSSVTAFDVTLGGLTYFSVAVLAPTATNPPTWTLVLSRITPNGSNCPAVYGCYNVTYIAPPGRITCSQSDCTSDLIP